MKVEIEGKVDLEIVDGKIKLLYHKRKYLVDNLSNNIIKSHYFSWK